MQCLLCNIIPNCMFSIQQKVVISCAKNSPAVKKGEAKNAQVHVHGVTTIKRHDIKLSWPDFDIMSFDCSYSMNMYLCILGLAFFYSWAVFGTGTTVLLTGCIQVIKCTLV